MVTETDVVRDVIVVGGGAAGLSGALTLARARREVLVIDGGEPRNAPAKGVHGFLTRDGMAPAELTRIGREEVRRYGGEVVTGQVVSVSGAADDFAVTTDDGAVHRARRLLVATGLLDALPAIPGVAERWGRDVIHCPYCHGWEVRDQRIAVIATGPMSVHQALLFSQLSDQVVLLAHDRGPLEDDDVEQLSARGVEVRAGEVERLEVVDDRLTGVVIAEGTVVPADAVVVATHMGARAQVLTDLGLVAEAHPMGVGDAVAAGPMGVTEVPGVWVAGNVTDLSAQVVGAAAAGVMAGAAINADLVQADTRAAIAARRAG